MTDQKGDHTIDREFLKAVRRVAGFRVAPRQIAPVLSALETRGQAITPENVAQIVTMIERGERSARQRRNADLWRQLGTYLALEGKPPHPEAQRALIGRVRRILGERHPDRVLLAVAVALGAAGYPIEARTIADAIRWLESRLGPVLTAETVEPYLREAIEAVAPLDGVGTKKPPRKPRR
ncbi:hypothetical protein OO015_10385 [Thermomicrobium sp. 4228-Ro]|uniref:hypothetical protein n=1 Tax=Thermomicrobium sp. 4228-Ro TaxID=2993937 RepID=UPI00224910AC|nr:hypothetical protein [Thermomicrobium sp. 4228-Ro]MCX2727895.1 hypothetical protein [Thermomicrobium sp. 4228-Ro]